MCRNIKTLSICPTCTEKVSERTNQQWCREGRHRGAFGRCSMVCIKPSYAPLLYLGSQPLWFPLALAMRRRVEVFPSPHVTTLDLLQPPATSPAGVDEPGGPRADCQDVNKTNEQNRECVAARKSSAARSAGRASKSGKPR